MYLGSPWGVVADSDSLVWGGARDSAYPNQLPGDPSAAGLKTAFYVAKE